MLDFLIWWLIIEVIGLLALPITLKLLRFLPDRGLTLVRQVGLLLSAYAFWLLVSLGVLQNTPAGIVGVLLGVGALSAYLWWRERGWMWPDLKARLRLLALGEGVFLVALAAFALFRAYNPEIMATEKPMEFGFINGILRSRTFPPKDPWLSGYAISYYYFGYVIIAMLTQLSGLVSDVTFNLAGAMLFALTVVSSYGLGYNLVRAYRAPRSPLNEAAAFVIDGASALTGLLAAVLVALMGNLEGVFELIRARGWGSEALWTWLDVRNLGATPPSVTWYPDDMWWWWRASRVIHDRDPAGNSMEVISEFPFFSFLLGDNHPHVLTLPFVLLALALALNLLLATRRRAAPEQEVAEPAETSPAPNLGRRITTFVGSLWDGGTFDWLMWAVVLGGLGFMNTWDYPIYLGIFVLVYAIRRQWSRAADLHWATEVIVFGGLLLLAGLVLYAPFYLGFRSQAAGIGLVGEVKTRLHQYLLMMGVFIFFVASVLVALAVRYLRLSPEERELPLLGQFGGIALGVVAAFGAVQGWWTVALVFALSALAAALLAWGSVHRAKGEPGTRLPPSVLFGLVMILAGLMLTGSVEFIFLRDTFGTRMNTVFKFYYQAWVLLALASASGAYYVYERLRRANRLALVTWSAVGALLVAAGLSYTVAATVSKAGDPEELTLDGTRYIERYRSADYHAVQWLREHAPEDAVMVEATGGSYSEYNWVSAHTGIPTLLGWGGHELQWRGSYDIPGQREPDIARIYQSTQPQPARDLLERYGVDYVYVGPLERQKYNLSPPMLQKFDRIMRRVYENDGVVIYGW